jgi:hypothetical protein
LHHFFALVIKKSWTPGFFYGFYMSKKTLFSGGVAMSRLALLKKRQVLLLQEITAHLDCFLIGSVAKSPSMSGYSLTTKVQGKTVTLYVRKNLVPMALEMSRRYNKLWALVQELSKVNWEVLKLENE